MKAFIKLLIPCLVLGTSMSFAGVSDPSEIVETSQSNSSVNMSGRRSFTQGVTQAVTDSVTQSVDSVKETVGTGVSTVKGWLNKGLDSIKIGGSPNEKKVGEKSVDKTKPSSANQAPAQIEMRPEKTPVRALSEREVKINELSNQIGQTPGLKKSYTSEDLKNAKNQIKKDGVAVVAKPGRKSEKNLSTLKSGVPIFPMEIKKSVKLPNGKSKIVIGPIKNIPKLDIGEEPSLTVSEFITKKYIPEIVEAGEYKSLPSPVLVEESLVKNVTTQVIVKAEPAKDLDKQKNGIDKIVTREAIAKAMPKIVFAQKVIEKPLRTLSEQYMQMMAAIILYSKNDHCPHILGLFDQLAKDEKLQTEAHYYLGQCAAQLKMHSLAFDRLSKIVQAEDKEFAASALEGITKDLPMDYEIRYSDIIKSIKNQKWIPAKIKDEVYYLTAKGLTKSENYTQAKLYAEKVSETSPRYPNSQYLIGIALFGLGDTKKGVAKLEGLRSWIKNKGLNERNLNSLIAINLARMKFTQGQYKEALPLYMNIEKDHPLWVQGLIEQGWTQLAQNDFSGAIGNMYSLHSPYFKAVYKPESFVVRTIGYLNICQYGDAYRTLSWLEKEYRPWLDGVKQYLSDKKDPIDYYRTSISYLKGKSTDSVDGLNYQVIREIARQKEFLNAQTGINLKADEYPRYSGIEKGIVNERLQIRNRETKAASRFRDIKNKVAKGEKDRVPVVQIDEWKNQMKVERDIVLGLRFQSELLEKSRLAYKQLEKVTLTQLESESLKLQSLAGKVLGDSLKRVQNEMGTVLENNEFLRYEVFAGSGENIRYQVAGGKVGDANRLPASVKPEKLQNWSFDGEYWEDEIGSYRSSLNNNCPQSGNQMEEFFKGREGSDK